MLGLVVLIVAELMAAGLASGFNLKPGYAAILGGCFGWIARSLLVVK